jgi:hypothetical protein
MKTRSRSLAYLVLALALLAPAAPAWADGGSYGYLRVVEGAVTLTPAGGDEPAGADVNQPVLAGDRITVPGHARVEILLADQSLLRVDSGSDLVLERLAASPDRDDRATVVRLLVGNLQLVVSPDWAGGELPQVETARAAVYPQSAGAYRVTADTDGWSQIVVRRGAAEVVAADGRATVAAGQEVVIDRQPGDDPQDAPAAAAADTTRAPEAVEAGGVDALERWGRQLDEEAAGTDQPYLDGSLRYAAAPLARDGDWIDYEGIAYWRPRAVDAGWRPYTHGRWVYLPSGLTWVSAEPWGWVPYHYGSWDFLPAAGWAWRPGDVWAPAWVYWYWGPSYVGWCPTGFYTQFYAGQMGIDFAFRDGLYGWAGGDWESFDQWSFVPAEYFGYADGYRDGYRDGYWLGYWDRHRDVQRYAVPTGRSGPRPPLERGLITTYTKPLRPGTWKSPQSVFGALKAGRSPLELPDVTPFIARAAKPDLPPAVAQAVAAEGPRSLAGSAPRPGRPRTGEGGAPAGSSRALQLSRPDAPERGGRSLPEVRPENRPPVTLERPVRPEGPPPAQERGREQPRAEEPKEHKPPAHG